MTCQSNQHGPTPTPTHPLPIRVIISSLVTDAGVTSTPQTTLPLSSLPIGPLRTAYLHARPFRAGPSTGSGLDTHKSIDVGEYVPCNCVRL